MEQYSSRDQSHQQSSTKRKWPSARYVLADISVAGVASALVSPLVAIIDSTVVTRSSTGQPLRSCLASTLRSMGRRPLALILSKPFRLVFAVYFTTYSTANVLDSIRAARHSLPPSTQSSSTTKFIATAAVSTATCTYKDGQLARMFTTTASAAAGVRPQSYALFVLRDALTIFASFTLPVAMAPWLTHLASTTQAGSYAYLGALRSESVSLKTSQMILPAAFQLVSTPIHLLGLDYHNNRGAVSLRERLGVVRQNVAVAIPLRVVRIVPAFGIGNVVNTSLREAVLK